MSSYAFWNNKGGVGKSFLSFVSSCEYAHRFGDSNVYVIDMCPQANLSETLLGGYRAADNHVEDLIREDPRRTISGYLEARLNSPFQMIDNVSDFVSTPHGMNPDIPENLQLVCGDNLLEIQSEAIRQTSQLAVPEDAWRQVFTWVQDLRAALRSRDDSGDSVFFIDCNPSFAVYTRLAMLAADHLIVPFTADESSRRAIENIFALVYGEGGTYTKTYAKIGFSSNVDEYGLNFPSLHTFVSNRETQYRGEPSAAFKAVIRTIEDTIDKEFEDHRSIFSKTDHPPSEDLVHIPDYHSASVVIGATGTPVSELNPGPQDLIEESPTLNREPLEDYKKALGNLVDRL